MSIQIVVEEDGIPTANLRDDVHAILFFALHNKALRETVKSYIGCEGDHLDKILDVVTPPEVCSGCGTEDPECGWTLMRVHDPMDRTCYHCAPPPYGDGRNNG